MAEGILLLGCPSLVATLGHLGRRGSLIERNPNYLSPSDGFDVINIDLRFGMPKLAGEYRYDLCVIDPPWYLHEFIRWMNIGLSQINLGGSILFSLWPETVRPSAKHEHSSIFEALSGVGRVETIGKTVYRLPAFEEVIFAATRLLPPQREGLLLRLIKQTEHLLDDSPFPFTGSEWFRFTLSGEQVALKVCAQEQQFVNTYEFDLAPFVLKSTSRRDPILPHINIWTSRNRVARLHSPISIVDGLNDQNETALRFLVEKMGMQFDPRNVNWGGVMATPSVMLRFRDVDVFSVEEHNKIFKEKGSVLWGLWLKSFENAGEILKRLTAKSVDRIYIANTSRKSNPEIFVCDVKRIISNIADVDDALVPEYYQERKAEVPIWFELASRIAEIDADKRLKALLGVPTIYFLDYDQNSNVINSAPQRQYKLKARDGRSI